jgi:hypothetical protein
MTDARHSCQTPGCKRTLKYRGYTEWVCQKCYSRVPPAIKREHTEAKKNLRKVVRKGNHDEIVAAWNRAEAAWMAVKDSARGSLPSDDVLRHIGVL